MKRPLPESNGLRDPPLKANPQCTLYFFRVHHAGKSTFDTCVYDKCTLAEAYQGLKNVYPFAVILALEEIDFAQDGLPKLTLTNHLKRSARDHRKRSERDDPERRR